MIHVSICENKGIYEKNKKKARRNSGLYVSHTLTLGQALMLAGLSVEGRFLCHACGPRRAWLKNYYPALSLISPFHTRAAYSLTIRRARWSINTYWWVAPATAGET